MVLEHSDENISPGADDVATVVHPAGGGIAGSDVAGGGGDQKTKSNALPEKTASNPPAAN